MISIPQTNPNTERGWNQSNQSDLFGNLFVTKGLTFDNLGYLQLSASSRAAINESVDSDFDNPAVILANEDYGYFTATWDDAFEVNQNILEVRPTQIVTAGVPTTDIETDAVWFGGLMPVSQDTDVDYYDPAANSWTDTNISLTASGQHQLVNFWSLSALAVIDVNTIKLYATPLTATPTLITTLVISADLEITCAIYFNQNLYIGTQNIYGGNAFMYVWNGLGTAASQAHEVESDTVLSGCVHDGAVHFTLGNGSIVKSTGGKPEFVDAFPMYYINQPMVDFLGNIPMYKNTMASNGHLLFINFSNEGNDTKRLLNQPDGIWCLKKGVGLHHRYPVSNALVQIESIVAGSVNTTTNQITVANNYVTGTEVVFNGSTGITPLVEGTKYFVINIDTTHIQLATTLTNAQAGTPIDLTAVGGTNTFTFFPNVDFGQYFAARSTALTVIDSIVDNELYGMELLWGGEVIRRDSTSDYPTLGTVSNGVEARGYFITPKVFSTDVTDVFNLVTLKFSPFTSALDKIIIKYRTTDDMREFINLSEWRITWTSTTTFTTTQTAWANAVSGTSGYEVEILQGAGAGLLAHISSISENGGTYTVTLDEAYANYVSGDRGVAVFRNFVKWKTITYGDSNANQYFLSEQIGAEGKFIQMKIELRGVRTRIEELLIDDVYRLPAKSKLK